LVVVGAFIAGPLDLSFDARGYTIVFVANITTAVYLATINRIGNAVSFLSLI
jgi:solute carrier family 35